jgi:hypothetical protein
MNGSNFMTGWVALTGSVAMIALIFTALGLMLGIVKPSDTARHVGAILGIVILLTVAPGILLSAWSAIPVWQRIALIAVGIGVWQVVRPKRHTGRKRGD